MKKYNKKTIAILALTILIIPMGSAIAISNEIETNQTTIPVFDAGYAGATSGFDWDPANYQPGTFLNTYSTNCLETLFKAYKGWTSGDYSELQPILATDWELEYWPEEINTYSGIGGPFINRGGVKAINFTLREGVKFHDGSDWNATVAKWNIDRVIILTGNLTGTVEGISREARFWDFADKWEEFYTASWNLSWAKDWYPEYNGVKNPKGKTYSPYDKFPKINNTQILENSKSGGKLRIEFNHWNPFPLAIIKNFKMISMQTYKDYNDTIIRGYGDVAPFDGEFPHLVGTGPYKHVSFDATGDPPGGTMIRNEGWWNHTAMAARGFHQVDQINVILFPSGGGGIDARNTAMSTGQLDFAYDIPGQPLVYEDMVANPSITYYERGARNMVELVSMSDVNNTWWKTLFNWGALASYGVTTLGHIPRLTRKAITYAFDYDIYINNVLGGRGVRAGPIPNTNMFYNDTWEFPERNLTIARQTLIDSGLYDMRGLTLSNSTADWRNIAETDPLATLDFYYSNRFEDMKNVYENSVKDIGIALNDDPSMKVDDVWGEIVAQNWNMIAGSHCLPQNRETEPTQSDTWTDMRGWLYDNGMATTDPGFNFAFSYNATSNYYIDRAFFSNISYQQTMMNNLVEWLTEYQYPRLYCAQPLWGDAFYGGFYAEDWPTEEDWEWTYLQYDAEAQIGEIPGYPILIMSMLSLVAIIGIISKIHFKK